MKWNGVCVKKSKDANNEEDSKHFYKILGSELGNKAKLLKPNILRV